ncbi:hypothetical protein P152DRAFT_198026 [Eremomyces bilateralis CBS 781.70]|uniref:WW domain-containing protein n=1 Tax=Eremomyces bilateralis CBS 781.70 TaxID=1392243 RepID=A0A6G1GD67_9PEZI|nr:uncharacterized protein P152DRAFT_198026 [Eremomyces bilateralis CBS 781.70]KAF1815841.1 hypothetical protein P152DRAFT_198026 [Eremomyces bilateralis CBS 781.70]
MDSNGRRHGRPEEELFFKKPTDEPDTPTVGPLRINKASSPEATSSGSGSAADVVPGHPAFSFPAPPTASNPLPYPDDRPPQAAGGRYTPLSERDRTSKNSTPESGRPREDSTSQGSPRARFSANDPNRPTLSGYAHAPTGFDGRTTSPQSSSLSERRQNVPRPLPESPGPDAPDKEGLFQRPPQRGPAAVAAAAPQDGGRRPSQAELNPYPEYHQQYWPPPNSGGPDGSKSSAGGGELRIPNPAGINRLSSTASTSTTRAQRGSPPPPETPAAETMPGGGIEARFAAAGVAGTGTLTNMQAQNLAAAQRAQPYQGLRPRTESAAAQQHQQQPARRPWTPTEDPGSQPHGPPTVYHGNSEVTTSPPHGAAGQMSPPGTAAAPGRLPAEHPIEHDMSRLNITEEPPPAYSTLQGAPQGGPGGVTARGYPNEKHPGAAGAAVGGAAVGAAVGAGVAGAALSQPTATTAPIPAAGGTMPAAGHQTHPAFANDPRQQTGSPQAGPSGTQQPAVNTSPAPGQAPPASPPPLPEGWIAHLDPNSGQYYYIHLTTQSTQWEFPKGPTPLNLNEPLSPTGTFVNPLASPTVASFGKPLASPGLPIAQSATYHDGMVGVAGLASPTAAGFTGPPPSAGVDVYKVQPTNGVYFGPYLRYTNMDIERGLWLGSILLVTDAPQPPTIHIHQSTDLSTNPRQLKSNPIYSHQRWMFYRYDIDLKMEDEGSVKWTYAITSHLGCTRYEFLVAGRYETAWRFIAHSGNDFALNVSANERTRLGGVGFMWKDILQKHIECNGFHAQLGLGDQIYADRMWKELPLLRQWTAMSGRENRKNAPWTARHEEDVTHAYFHYYTSHFDQPHLREAFAQIPHVLTLDDHDIFDGFGSYPEYMQFSNMFKNIGRVGVEMYLLFQHHTTLEILRNVSNDMDLFTITGTGWHFLKYLGPAVVVVGPDTRSERNPHQVMAGPTYQGLFPKVALLPPSVQHCIWMVPVPLVYPRLESMEHLAQTVATGKKVATGTFNMLGKVTSSVAGVVGAKGVVGEGFNSVKKAVGKSGLMSGILSPFGELGVSDELRDSWMHESKDLERTYLIRTLQGIAHNKSLRMTFFSGDVNCCGAGLVHDPSHPQDHKTMYQIISSAVGNAPPSPYVLRLLHNNRPLYVPANGHRSTHQPSDTKEDMMEIFSTDVNGTAREMKKLMARRNYVACVAYDPEIVESQFGQATPGKGSGRMNLAVDFLVQNEGVYGQPMKYGPVIIPSLEYGR